MGSLYGIATKWVVVSVVVLVYISSVDDIKMGFKGSTDVPQDTFDLPQYIVSRSGGLHMNRWCAMDIDAEIGPVV